MKIACLLLMLSMTAVAASAQTVLVRTSAGDIRVQLDPAKAPKSVDNFVQYVKEHHYDGTIFHRVIPGFMIQGGGYDASLFERPTRPPIKLESRNGLSNLRGTIAMARESDPDTATAQFFINVVDNPRLDGTRAGEGYAVFGHVVSGMDVVDKIRRVPTKKLPPLYEALPQQTVTIQSITVEK